MTPPLTPESDEAQRWLEEELLKGVYSEQRSFWAWLWEKISEFLERVFAQADGIQGVFLPLLILAVTGGIITLAFIYGRSVRRPRSRRATPTGMWQAEDHRSADDLRQAARQAASASDYSLAVIEQFRAIVRSVEQRGVIEPTDGMTALEVARDIARGFPDHAPEIQNGATLFNSALYGTGRARASDYESLVHLELHLSETPVGAK